MTSDEVQNEVRQAQLTAAHLSHHYGELSAAVNDAGKAALLRTLSIGCKELEIELADLWSACTRHDANDSDIRARLIQLQRDGLRKTAKAVDAAD